MQSVGTKHTGPELLVRQLLTRLGYRYRLHGRRLPGRPDITFVGRKKVIFVHGCFWHGHGCRKGRAPKSRPDYWLPKIDGNRARDLTNEAKLHGLGWATLVVWQCELQGTGALEAKIVDFLGPPKNSDRLRA